MIYSRFIPAGDCHPADECPLQSVSTWGKFLWWRIGSRRILVRTFRPSTSGLYRLRRGTLPSWSWRRPVDSAATGSAGICASNSGRRIVSNGHPVVNDCNQLPEHVDDLGGRRTERSFILVQLAQDPLLAGHFLDVEFAPHFFHHGNVVEHFEAVPVDPVAGPVNLNPRKLTFRQPKRSTFSRKFRKFLRLDRPNGNVPANTWHSHSFRRIRRRIRNHLRIHHFRRCSSYYHLRRSYFRNLRFRRKPISVWTKRWRKSNIPEPTEGQLSRAGPTERPSCWCSTSCRLRRAGSGNADPSTRYLRRIRPNFPGCRNHRQLGQSPSTGTDRRWNVATPFWLFWGKFFLRIEALSLTLESLGSLVGQSIGHFERALVEIGCWSAVLHLAAGRT